jgi:hypothetical protein
VDQVQVNKTPTDFNARAPVFPGVVLLVLFLLSGALVGKGFSDDRAAAGGSGAVGGVGPDKAIELKRGMLLDEFYGDPDDAGAGAAGKTAVQKSQDVPARSPVPHQVVRVEANENVAPDILAIFSRIFSLWGVFATLLLMQMFLFPGVRQKLLKPRKMSQGGFVSLKGLMDNEGRVHKQGRNSSDMPYDCVELRGDLNMLSVPDLLQLLSSCKRTGTLIVQHGREQKSLRFEDGKICSAACLDKDRKNQLGYILVKMETISAAERTRALAMCERDPAKRLGQALVEIEAISEEELLEVLRLQAEEIVYSMIAFPEGFFEFTSSNGAAAAELNIGLELDVMSLVMEGVRRQDEWARIRQRIPSLDVVLDFVERQKFAVDIDDMNEEQREIVDHIDGEHTLSEICAKSHLVEFEVCTFVHGLLSDGILAKVEAA